MRETFDDGSFADAGFADEHGIIFGAPRKNLDDAADFFIASNNRIELAAARLLVQVASVTLQRLVLGFGVLVGNLLRAANHGECFQDGIVKSAPWRARICCATSRLRCVIASSRCSVETYSSLKFEASLKA